MAREQKAAAPREQELPEAITSISDMLAAALAKPQPATVRGALAALQSALVDLKARAASIEEHLGADPILERIKAL